ncbi:MAG: pyruvate formate lyase-activating protein [Clostridia bacterium]|nr:pyruvate formate lyase-activating protein [Clostridia bacterium]
MQGRIHSFQSLGTVDGPGVRCVVFMQGCPLRCICCHNPDTWDPNGGEAVEVQPLVRKILRFRGYFGQRGGVTVSGGEPLLQAPFVAELFRRLKENGIHTALDTSGCFWNESAAAVLTYTDLVLLDHKYPTEADYRRFVGGSLAQTERFLTELERRQIPVWLRRVIIPQKTDREASVRQLNDVARRFSCVKKVELLPFRNLCEEKYTALGLDFPLKGTDSPSHETMQSLTALIDPIYLS